MVILLFLIACLAIRFTPSVNYRIQCAASSAAYSGDLTKLRIFRLLGADIHRSVPGRGPMIVSAAWTGQREVIKYLLEAGVDIDSKDKFGGTALTRASQNGHLELVRMLLAAGADPNIQDLEGGNTPIDFSRLDATRKGFNPSPIVELIASAGGTPNTTKDDEQAVVSAGTIEIKAVPDMSTAKITTGKAAENVVVQKVVADPNDGLSSTHGPTAQLAFMLGFDVADFGKRGDRVWQVHFVALDGHTARIAWVNAETGNVKFLMEETRRIPNKASDATTEPVPGTPSSMHQH